MASSTFRVRIRIPRQVILGSQQLSREDFFEALWNRFSALGLLGVHEGTLLSEEAAEKGLETESWTVDAGEAPRERDWVESQAEAQAELYFDSQTHAEEASGQLRAETNLEIGPIEEQLPEDWDAQWKASFLSSPSGIDVPPFWKIVPPWLERSEGTETRILRINPGAGFGTGTHETTQLCLGALAESWPRVLEKRRSPRVLDFGSGSGILSIAAAILGARVDGVEIDPLAIDNALDNAKLNGVEDRVVFSKDLSAAQGHYSIVIANILKPVLLEFAEALVSRLDPAGVLILSGLIEADVSPVSARYGSLLGGRKPQARALAEWRSLVWNRS